MRKIIIFCAVVLAVCLLGVKPANAIQTGNPYKDAIVNSSKYFVYNPNANRSSDIQGLVDYLLEKDSLINYGDDNQYGYYR